MTEAPRWRLINAHYINVLQLQDGTRVEWEHKETSRENGRTIRKLFPVPMLLDPKDPADCNWPGEIIVARQTEGVRNDPRDICFLGDPTPEMEPLNDEAQAITDTCRHRWEHPIESLPANGGMTEGESTFMSKMMEAFAKVAPPQIDNTAVPKAEYDALKERLAALEAKLNAAPTTPPVERRV